MKLGKLSRDWSIVLAIGVCASIGIERPDANHWHDRRKISKLKRLIGHFGQIVPLIIDAHRTIIDGHAIWQAMRELGSREIATVQSLRLSAHRSR